MLVKLVVVFRRGRVLQGKQDVKGERMGSEGWFCDDLVRTGLTPTVKEVKESHEDNQRQDVAFHTQRVGPGAGAQLA